jgi:hypothetical protein
LLLKHAYEGDDEWDRHTLIYCNKTKKIHLPSYRNDNEPWMKDEKNTCENWNILLYSLTSLDIKYA